MLLQEETRKIAEYTDYRMVSVVGGQSIEEQGFKLRKARAALLGFLAIPQSCARRRHSPGTHCCFALLEPLWAGAVPRQVC